VTTEINTATSTIVNITARTLCLLQLLLLLLLLELERFYLLVLLLSSLPPPLLQIQSLVQEVDTTGISPYNDVWP